MTTMTMKFFMASQQKNIATAIANINKFLIID